MDLIKFDCEVFCDSVRDDVTSPKTLTELDELHLALVGGGIGDFIPY